MKLRKEKDEEIEKREKERDKYEKQIKELEDRIRMLMSESGDQHE
jgi:peptidoglycan hydrolase CwlO-like protein